MDLHPDRIPTGAAAARVPGSDLRAASRRLPARAVRIRAQEDRRKQVPAT